MAESSGDRGPGASPLPRRRPDGESFYGPLDDGPFQTPRDGPFRPREEPVRGPRMRPQSPPFVGPFNRPPGYRDPDEGPPDPNQEEPMMRREQRGGDFTATTGHVSLDLDSLFQSNWSYIKYRT